MSSATTRALHLRPMLQEDLVSVMQIERAAHSVTWSKGNFRDCLTAGYTCLLLIVDKTIVGYGVMSLGAGEAHILNLCIHPSHQRQGLGQRLLTRLLDIAVQQGSDSAFLEVRHSNQRALALYRNCGFNEIGVRRNYYPTPHGKEDAVMLARSLVWGVEE